MRNMKTFTAKPSEVQKKWYHIDANGKNLGRTASRIAAILRGKNKPEFTPHMDAGDFVVVTNAEKIAVTGKKELQKEYHHHSRYPGGFTTTTLAQLREKHPERILENAVKGMLPKNSLGRSLMKKLKICVGDSHRYQAQKPETIDI